MSNKSNNYKPGFFCILFWLITWLGIFAGIAVLFFLPENAVKLMIWFWSISGAAAIISYFIRTMEKSSHDGHWSWHWFD